jgi:hypothetical protein
MGKIGLGKPFGRRRPEEARVHDGWSFCSPKLNKQKIVKNKKATLI